MGSTDREIRIVKRMMSAVISTIVGAVLTTCAAAHEREAHVTPDRPRTSDCEQIAETSDAEHAADPLALALSEQCRRVGDEHGGRSGGPVADEASATGERN